MMILRRTSSFCFLLVLLASALPALAQTPDDTQDELLLRGTNRALVFTLDALSLDGLDGGLGMRWWMGPNTAVRATFRLSVESIEDVTQGRIDSGRSAFGVGAGVLIELHTHQFRRVSPYFAAGTGVGFDAFSETTDFAPDNPLQRQRNKGTSIDFIINAGFGVEVYLAKSVSLAGEHLFRASVQTVDGTETNIFLAAPETVFKRDATAFIFGTGTSSLILSVYF